MKFRLYIALLFSCILIGVSIGCQKELNFDGQPGGTPKVCISCNYLPVCDSSVYTYIDSTAQGIDTNRSVVRLIGDSVVEGLTYNRVSTLGFFGQGVLYNCDANTYKVYLNLANLGFDLQDIIDSLAGGLPIPPGLITPPQQLLVNMLKVNEPAGATWKDIILKPTIPLISLEVAINHTLLRKDFTHQVLGKSYPNTIEMYSVIGLKGSPPIPSAEFATLRIFYARGVGIIEGRLATNGTTTTLRKLSSIQKF